MQIQKEKEEVKEAHDGSLKIADFIINWSVEKEDGSTYLMTSNYCFLKYSFVFSWIYSGSSFVRPTKVKKEKSI